MHIFRLRGVKEQNCVYRSAKQQDELGAGFRQLDPSVQNVEFFVVAHGLADIAGIGARGDARNYDDDKIYRAAENTHLKAVELAIRLQNVFAQCGIEESTT